MPTNKKENIVFGICMCVIMVFFMGLLNISIHLGGFSLNSFKTALVAFPLTLLIAYILETFIINISEYLEIYSLNSTFLKLDNEFGKTSSIITSKLFKFSFAILDHFRIKFLFNKK